MDFQMPDKSLDTGNTATEIQFFTYHTHIINPFIRAYVRPLDVSVQVHQPDICLSVHNVAEYRPARALSPDYRQWISLNGAVRNPCIVIQCLPLCRLRHRHQQSAYNRYSHQKSELFFHDYSIILYLLLLGLIFFSSWSSIQYTAKHPSPTHRSQMQIYIFF